MLTLPVCAAAAEAGAAGAPLPGAKDGGDRPAWEGDLDTRAALLGSLGGLRPWLEGHGIALGLNETGEGFGNPLGGFRRTAIGEGLTQMSVGVDLDRAAGWQGALFNASAYAIHGRGLTITALANLNVVSSIEADPATRLNELWVQQSFWGGKADLKVGQQSADFEFITSEHGDLFLNSGFGWPTLPSLDLPSGGPAYPLATPAVRLRARPTDSWTVLAAVYDGSPAGLRLGDPQRADPAGLNFNLGDGVTLFGEMQYATGKGPDARELPGTYKLGAWINTNRFADAFYANGATLEPPGVLDGIPRSFRDNWSVYGTLDQIVYRPAGDEDGGLAVTARAMGAPDDRNLVDLFIQGGLTYKGVFGRKDDQVGLALEWARIGARARAGDAAARALAGFDLLRSAETVLEVTYQAQVAPWWQLQPDLQVIGNPGGGVPVPGTTRRDGTAVVLGLRSVVTF